MGDPWATIVPLKFRTLWLLPISISGFGECCQINYQCRFVNGSDTNILGAYD